MLACLYSDEVSLTAKLSEAYPAADELNGALSVPFFSLLANGLFLIESTKTLPWPSESIRRSLVEQRGSALYFRQVLSTEVKMRCQKNRIRIWRSHDSRELDAGCSDLF